MNIKIEKLIVDYVAAYPALKNTKTQWKKPIVGVAKADNTKFEDLKESVRATHLTPLELLENAKSVISFFLAFDESVAKSNVGGNFSSVEWAEAYIDTNKLIGDLSHHIIEYLNEKNYVSKTIAATHNFDAESLMSDWSHRHIAEITGIGKFGLNNMLITEKGCAGRVGSVVTSLDLNQTPVAEGENCLAFKNDSCGICVKQCPQNAFEKGFNRFKCHELLLENDAYHKTLGLVDVCGKCCTALPCTFKNPCKV